MNVCQVDGCSQASAWRVISGLRRTLEVCSKCRDELCAVSGWKLV